MRVFLVFIGVVAGFYLLGRWALRVGPARAAHVIRWFAVVVGLFALLFLALRGGAGLALPLLVLLLPVLARWRQLWHSPSSSPTSADPAFSTVETRFLRVSLEHSSGKIWGTVLSGRFANRELSDLNLENLLELWRECQGDAQSVAILEAYLDRTCEEDWRMRDQWRQDKEPASDSGAMSLQDAYEILGLAPGASRDEIKAAHRRLMQRVHPDHGGSGYLASRVNRAKDVLLNG